MENTRLSPQTGYAVHMGKKCRILWAVLLVAVVAAVVWLSMPSPEPVYQGKRLSYWLAGYDTGNYNVTHPKGPSPPTAGQADEAIRQIGTNALPTLLRMLQLPNPTLTDRVLAVARKQHFIKIPFGSANLNKKAFFALMALGSQASNAVPQLIAIFEKNPSSFPQTAAPAILGTIGPAAEQAIPALLVGLSYTKRTVRNNAIFALGRIHAQPKLVVPALIKCLDDSDQFVQEAAVVALGAFGNDAQTAVPTLLELRRKALSEAGATNSFFSSFAVSSSSVEMFSGPLKSSAGSPVSPDMVESTTKALKRIDPAAAEKAGGE
jgi:HEAT repeat protein